VSFCKEWDYWLQVPSMLTMATDTLPGGGRFATGGGAAAGGDSLWETYYDLAFCEANQWEFCGGPGGSSGGFVYIATPSLMGTGVIDARGGAGTSVLIGGYGGGGGGGGLIVIHAVEISNAIMMQVQGGEGGRSGRDFTDTELPPAANGTSGAIYKHLIS
jgi:hypothetical protein